MIPVTGISVYNDETGGRMNLDLPQNKFSFSFQSRLLKDPWLKPYTDFRLQEMPAEGIKKLLVVCPAFVSDCLETLEEIEIRGKESFLQSGGQRIYDDSLFKYPSALGQDPGGLGQAK